MTFLTFLPSSLGERRRRWLVTGAAGFIGSNLVETLVAAGQEVIGFDNFATTGYQSNLNEIGEKHPELFQRNFRLIEGDIRDRGACADAVRGVDVILHQAALGSVPRSIADPLTTHDVNITGFLNLLDAARLAGAPRFIYAASSSTYGDEPSLPKREERIGNPLSPYATTKLADEIYASVYDRTYGYKTTGLRYFNVFGPRQDPNGAYAAVIPKWTAEMISDEPVTINGDGQTSRNFCYVANAVQANIRAALAPEQARGQVYNVAVGDRTSLLELFEMLRTGLRAHQVHYDREAILSDFRKGDIRHSLADISKARGSLGYDPTYSVGQGIFEALPWYLEYFRKTEMVVV